MTMIRVGECISSSILFIFN